MANENVGLDITLAASADLSSYQYYFVELSANDTVSVCNALTDRPIGILQNKPAAAGRPAVVRVVGYSKVSSDAALTAGDLLGTSADGQGATKVAGTNVTHYLCGQVIKGTTVAAQLAEAFICCANVRRAA